MAKQVITSLIDDIDGKPADHTIEFGLDGVGYTIDLSDKNADKLRAALHPYIEAGNRVGRVGGSNRPVARSRGAATTRANRDQTAAIREWAVNNGYEVSHRGRIPAKVVEAYEEAHRR
ncbi:histone-like nucleoid-structuring protein Lsr2 [Rhizomonospora bruguierae]|uniref:histone-like nucleoid-structuring protein Lsr2 n=1 Tax=Rhizomonospora bruguierae TaxID=1581705 RepID=UPI001BD16A9D|nr:Lsr2 family protein [Micromonospora sp. NBRC 107566]